MCLPHEVRARGSLPNHRRSSRPQGTHDGRPRVSRIPTSEPHRIHSRLTPEWPSTGLSKRHERLWQVGLTGLHPSPHRRQKGFSTPLAAIS